MPRNPSPKYSRSMERRKIDQGAVRMPGGLLPADAAAALARLVACGYAPNKTQAIARALIDAGKNAE